MKEEEEEMKKGRNYRDDFDEDIDDFQDSTMIPIPIPMHRDDDDDQVENKVAEIIDCK